MLIHTLCFMKEEKQDITNMHIVCILLTNNSHPFFLQ